ncbi:MAG: GntR family transcriptional regulator [Verrucomicrobiota bacterium]
MPSENGVRSRAADIEKYLRGIADEGVWPEGEALPTTRALGEKFGVANTTASRVLHRLEQEGLVWKQDNGRYFLESSRQLVHRPKPIACLTRELERWSGVYRAIMAGVSAYTSQRQTALLLWRSESLVSHSDVNLPPQYGSLDQQTTSLQDFERCYGDTHGGVLIDDIWSDKALIEYPDLLKNAVVLYRETGLPGVGNVCIDTESGSLLALTHLLARGYEELWIARPFRGDAAMDALVDDMAALAEKAGSGSLLYHVKEAGNPDERRQLIAETKQTSKRIGIFCPEDNVCKALYRELLDQEVDCPGQVGLLSGMGTSVLAGEEISTLCYDFREMGLRAAEMIYAGAGGQVKLRPELLAKTTT